MDNNTLLIAIKERLANHLGINSEDISLDDTFFEDLHMKPSEFSDFVEELHESGTDTSQLDLPSIKSVGDMIEALTSDTYTT